MFGNRSRQDRTLPEVAAEEVSEGVVMEDGGVIEGKYLKVFAGHVQVGDHLVGSDDLPQSFCICSVEVLPNGDIRLRRADNPTSDDPSHTWTYPREMIVPVFRPRGVTVPEMIESLSAMKADLS
jgi:hypothetical protein